jgi:hypothetical protein
MKKLRVLILALKYWIRGGDWDFALKYARYLVYGWGK